MRKICVHLGLAALLMLPLSACGDDRAHTGKGTSSLTAQEENMVTDEENNDMRLGLDRYKGLTRKFPDGDGGDQQTGLDRENGWDGFDQDGVNNWRDYVSNAPDVNHRNTRLEIADRAANALASLNTVRTAHVLLTDRNAYVAVMTEYGYRDKIDDVRRQIVEQVRSTIPGVNHVFVSGDPGFISAMDNIVARMRKGESGQGIISEFNAAAERFFPLPATLNR